MKLLSFDVESNGLHGEAFAVAALLMTSNGTIEAEFLGRCPISGPVDAWVQDNVLPPMADIPETYPTPRALRDAFWKWYLHHKPQADFTLANNPYPVEARFLLACYEDDPAERATGHPWPFIDVASLLLAAGAATKPEREVFVKQVIANTKDQSHNPRWDAWVAALTAFRALEASGRHIDRV
jgi:hypothetical protein